MPDPSDADSSYDLAPVSPPAGDRPPPKPDSVPAGMPRSVPAGMPQAAAPLVERNCPHCGFRVVGRPRGNRCPECSAALNETAGDLLQFSPPRFTRTLALGALLLMIAIFMHAAGILRAFDRVHFWKPFPIHAAAAGLACLGTFLLTRQDPLPASRRPALTWIARSLSILVLLLWLFLAARPPADPEIREPRVDALMLIAQLFLAALIYVNCTYARQLALRVPNDSVAHHFYLISYAFPPMLFVLLYGHYFDLALFMTAFFCGIPAIAVLGGTALWLAVTLLRLFVDLLNAATAADSIAIRRQRMMEAQKRPPQRPAR